MYYKIRKAHKVDGVFETGVDVVEYDVDTNEGPLN